MIKIKYLEIIVDENAHCHNQLCTRKELVSLLTLSYPKIVQIAKERGIKAQYIGGVFLYNARDFGF